MAVKLEQLYTKGASLEELRRQLKRIPSRFQEYRQVNIRREKASTQGGRFTAWDFPEAPFHDLKVKMK